MSDSLVSAAGVARLTSVAKIIRQVQFQGLAFGRALLIVCRALLHPAEWAKKVVATSVIGRASKGQPIWRAGEPGEPGEADERKASVFAGVAQIFNLLYRRIAFGSRSSASTRCGFQIRDTAQRGEATLRYDLRRLPPARLRYCSRATNAAQPSASGDGTASRSALWGGV
ncbi:MAG: hypothetical protein HYY23_08735 [Verrucomicrobia bacterium]|nr:hypothetical protein [Verrucomicrobiota bacterium]